VPLAVHQTAAACDLVAFPELSACVVLRSTQENAGRAPILAGPVDLVRGSGLVGRTRVLYVAPGEKYELGWGPDADLRVKRRLEEHQEKSRLLSSWIDQRRKVEVRLSNLGAGERQVLVTERVPVSEIDKVRIEVDPKKTTGGQKPDTDGLVRWTVTLGPYGHETLQLDYTLRRHEDVVGL
jgi:uncharacterized protein (TIGR02231 family)